MEKRRNRTIRYAITRLSLLKDRRKSISYLYVSRELFYRSLERHAKTFLSWQTIRDVHLARMTFSCPVDDRKTRTPRCCFFLTTRFQNHSTIIKYPDIALKKLPRDYGADANCRSYHENNENNGRRNVTSTQTFIRCSSSLASLSFFWRKYIAFTGQSHRTNFSHLLEISINTKLYFLADFSRFSRRALCHFSRISCANRPVWKKIYTTKLRSFSREGRSKSRSL